LYNEKRSKLGEDPLRNDADPESLWTRVQKSKKSIGALIMDQSYFTGPGNIYRAEILFKAGVHPNKPGKDLEKTEFDIIWYHTVALLKRGYETGSILTVDPEEAVSLGKPRLRRYIYNSSKCPRCDSPIKTWQIANRTCYACVKCHLFEGAAVTVVVFSSSVAVASDCLVNAMLSIFR
jgi:formamidopyrimidine-DNA glycosylase